MNEQEHGSLSHKKHWKIFKNGKKFISEIAYVPSLSIYLLEISKSAKYRHVHKLKMVLMHKQSIILRS